MKKILNLIKKFGNGIYWAFVVFVLFLGLVVFMSTMNIGEIQIFSVMSGSMSPRIFSGSLIMIKPSQRYNVNDVISYKQKDYVGNLSKGTITHRIIKAEKNEDKYVYTTKGDRNPSEDTEKVEKEQILGKVTFTFPLIGYAASFAKTQIGFVLLVIIPAVLIVFSEVMKLKNQFKTFLSRKVFR